MLPRVEGKPYEADCESSFVSENRDAKTATHTTTGVMARDSTGRRFQQQDSLPAGADEQPIAVFDSESGSVTLRHFPRLANIYDPVGGAWHLIDREAGTTLMSIPVTLDQSGEYGRDVPTAEIQGKSMPIPVGGVPESGCSVIGKKVLEGTECTGYCSAAGSQKIEYWIADDLQETILARFDIHGKEMIFRVYNIRRTEPDPQLFVIPPPDPRPDMVVKHFVQFTDED